jgi:hypothetical protein
MTTVAGHRPAIRGKARTRRNAAIAVSVLAHVAVLAIVGLAVPKMVLREPPPIQATDVWLMPPLTLNQHKPGEHKAAQAKLAALPATVKAPNPAPTAKPAPSAKPPQAPAQAAQGQGRPQAALGSGKALPEPPSAGADENGSVQEALRTSVGCDYDRPMHLTPGEVDRCNQTAGGQARSAKAFVGIDPLKRGRFDEQVAADERKRADRTGPMRDMMIPCNSPDAVSVEHTNLAAGCLPKSAVAHVPF